MRPLALLLQHALVVLLALSPVLGRADEEAETPSDVVNDFQYRIQETVKQLNHPSSCDATCMARMSQTEWNNVPARKQCPENYRDVFKKDEVNVRVAFGYMDNGGGVEDKYAAQVFKQRLSRDCPRPGMSACGFTRDPDDAELFYKVIVVPDKYGRPREKTVNVRIKSSAVTDREKGNRIPGGKPTAAQARKSREAEEFWKSGLQEADVNFYVGHARWGSGPSFGPTVLNPKTMRTDRAHYERTNESAKSMVNTLAEGGPQRAQAKVVGVFACDAEKHFGNSLRAASPKSALLLPQGEVFFDAMVAQAYLSLDAIMGNLCADDFRHAMNSIDRVPELPPTAPIQFTNMFKPKR